MKARIVAWNGPYRDFHYDVGFITLNDFRFGPIREIEEESIIIADKMKEEFETLYPEFRYNHMQVVTEEDYSDLQYKDGRNMKIWI